MAIVVVIWGANFAFVKASLAEIAPLSFAALRFVIASITLVPLLRWREGSLMVPKGTFWRLVLLGIVGHTLYQALFVQGLSRTTTANSAMILSTTPAFVALAGAIIGIERVTRRMAAGIVIASLGIVVVMVSRGASFSLRTKGGFTMMKARTAIPLLVRNSAARRNIVSVMRLLSFERISSSAISRPIATSNFVAADVRRLGSSAEWGVRSAESFSKSRKRNADSPTNAG